MAYLSDVKSVRAGGVAGLIESLHSQVLSAIKRIAVYRDYVRAEKQLNRMSDRELDDIGVSRGEIHDRVWANYSAL